MFNSTAIHKMRVGITVLTVTCLIAICGYVVAGWSYVDALYMVVITIFGVGYSEVQPIDSPSLKLFTASLIVAGCSSAIYVLGAFIQMITEGEVLRAIGAHRMSLGIKETTGHVIVCGYGRVGQNLVKELRHLGVDFVVIDRDMQRLNEAEREGHLVICGDASCEETLTSAGIDRASAFAAVLPSDAENVFATLTARELNESIEIVARCETESTERKLYRSGATRVVLPTMIGASRIAHLITCPTIESIVDDTRSLYRLNQDLKIFGLDLLEIPIDGKSAFQNRTVREIESSGDGGNVIVAIRGHEGDIVRNPEANRTIVCGDHLIVLSHREDLAKLHHKVSHQGATLASV
ncbi:potassium channel family protein [Rhodopirellula sp. MGV]|uniref:potassium channel family protein n=1 Tax=Rhodopirellula sp. MGV TaxID=2023130 RepID=UPI0013044306|nr:potassium channel protein [Rhodopirellula sp. MGV]